MMSGVLDQLTDERMEQMKRLRFGLYRGIVRDVDDPEEQGRIRVEGSAGGYVRIRYQSRYGEPRRIPSIRAASTTAG
jgi:hypothetical protein